MSRLTGHPEDSRDLQRLADLIRARNANETAISRITGRPAHPSHIAKYIASRIFDIELARRANNPGSSGRFRSGRFAGKSVNVKWYPKRQGTLDIGKFVPDVYLVLAGPKSAAATSRGTVSPWGIREVFLFEAKPLLAALGERCVKVGNATGLREEDWARARIYPASNGGPLGLTAAQRCGLGLFDLFR